MMRKFCRFTLCTFALCISAATVTAQTTDSSTATADASITPLSVLGIVTELNLNAGQVTVKTAAGNQVTVSLTERTEFMRIPPGEKTKDKFIRITVADFAVGDSVFVRGKMSEDRKSMPALEFYVMSKTDIAQKKEREREKWQKRGIVGAITALNPDAKEITLSLRSPEGPKTIIVAPKADTRLRRYSPDSVRFSDAKPSVFADLKVGDQLRALGTKSPDGLRFTPEEIVSGSFQTIGGTITAVNLQNNEISIKDLQNGSPLTIVISKDSLLRRLTPEVLAKLVPPKTGDAGATPGTSSPGTPPGTSTAATGAAQKGSGDLREMFDQLPALSIQELKPGEMILISSTKGKEPTRITAIALVSGVQPLLQGNQRGRPGAVTLGAMNLGIGGP
jgi:hypothetical protein